MELFSLCYVHVREQELYTRHRTGSMNGARVTDADSHLMITFLYFRRFMSSHKHTHFTSELKAPVEYRSLVDSRHHSSFLLIYEKEQIIKQ